MRTQDEIVGKMHERSSAILDFWQDVLLECLDFEHAEPFLRPEETADKWPVPKTEQDIRAALADYMAFAWGAVEDHRGISASRSVDKCSAYVWLLGDDATLATVESTGYAQYGAPKLAVICEANGLPIPDEDWARRMIDGRPCVPGCDSGCGQ